MALSITNRISVCTLLWLAAVTPSCVGAPSTARSNVIQKALFQGPQIYLTVSAEAGYRNEGGHTVLLDRMLQIHWENFDNLPDDSIGIYSENPQGKDIVHKKASVLETHPVTSSSGMIKSSVRYERIPLNTTMDRCLGFWIAYTRQSEVLMADCLSIHPTWMNDLKAQIKNVPLSSLMIPGTHNAGSWHYYDGLPSEGVLIEYTYCHEDTIYDQLVNGIRSLDVRVGHYPLTAEKFYVNHDAVRIRPLTTLLEDVRKFVLETNEIIFLDFHRFPVGFNSPETHHELVTLLQTELKDLLAPKSLTISATPEQFWNQNRTVIALYSENDIAAEYDLLWPGLQQAWGDTNKLDELESYLGSSIESEGCRNKAWSLMAELTPSTEDVILRPSFGVRGFANLSNSALSQWFQRESWYSKTMIVALDYYRSTNLIETAIEVNQNLGNVCV